MTTHAKSKGDNRQKSQEIALKSFNHGVGRLLEAVVVVLLPVSSSDSPLHVGTLGKDSV